ncbi:MAG TPA: zinc-dependent alcohol dehydrogenase family protein [Casimicrobiaceae bacterium]|nr:zinc-dependent alcohol dehydrogenase family protein [Casimicrobiaceae bacterium]
MRAMVCEEAGRPLAARERPCPVPGAGQVLVAVTACGVCRTDLHLVDGELPQARLPVVPGHEIVGTVAACGPGVARLAPGMRVGIPWLGWTCGACDACRRGLENLCPHARFTGCSHDGGYAEFTVADERYAFPLPERYDDLHAAPLLCAGLIGYRAYAMAPEARVLGLYGFGAAAHLIAQVALAEGRRVLAFTRPGDARGQAFARAIGVHWAGDSTLPPPETLDAALLFAPVGALVPAALAAVRPGGQVVCAGIHMSDIPGFPYRLLWEERSVRSVANLTRADAEAFLALAGRVPLAVHASPYPLDDANRALDDVRRGRIDGAAVLTLPADRASND